MRSALFVILVFSIFHKQIGFGKTGRHYDTQEKWQTATLRSAILAVVLLAIIGAIQWYFNE
ncbi:hypothetical protein DHW03_01700 [Pedobacter yonginense]|uniref:Uncharacterized protein n=1 Tax=Pedobacter yonginense TaxID=651869 RepID=A0A317EP40_9SPHI|nr:hypothetical protein [Pedobacter yonginense]PWS28591.1 hypothetical protein DHW03_01700 [Pedobacter yonginense]